MKTLDPRKSSPPDFIRILGSRVDRVLLPEVLQRVRQFIADGTPHHLITANTLMFLEAQRDSVLQAIVERASLIIPESWGIFWASRCLGEPLLQFIAGIDLLQHLCQLASEAGQSAFLLGAQLGVAQRAGEELAHRYPGLNIVGTHHGFFSEAEEAGVIATIRQAAPVFLFVGMSVPGQEKWIARNLAAMNIPIVMGVGGSFDVLSGRLRRAPSWMRRTGIEWLYRLVQEPWRWRRIAQLPVFAWKVITETRKTKTQNSKLKNV